MTLKVNCDREAELRLLCQGEVVASEEASQSLTFVPEEAGEYRVEVRLDGKPWIYSNHIYLRNPRYRRPVKWLRDKPEDIFLPKINKK